MPSEKTLPCWKQCILETCLERQGTRFSFWPWQLQELDLSSQLKYSKSRKNTAEDLGCQAVIPESQKTRALPKAVHTLCLERVFSRGGKEDRTGRRNLSGAWKFPWVGNTELRVQENQNSLVSTGQRAVRKRSTERILEIRRVLSWLGISTRVWGNYKSPNRISSHAAEHSCEARNYTYSTRGTGKCPDWRTLGGRHRRPPISRWTELALDGTAPSP